MGNGQYEVGHTIDYCVIVLFLSDVLYDKSIVIILQPVAISAGEDEI